MLASRTESVSRTESESRKKENRQREKKRRVLLWCTSRTLSTRREDSVAQIKRVTTQGKSPSATSLPLVPQEASHSSST